MTQLVSGALFIATAKTEVLWGRELSPTEASSILAQKSTFISGGTQVTAGEPDSDEDGSTITYWSNTADATAFVAFLNTFTPPPTSAAVTTL
jgi:hypothetical protein